MFEKDDIMAFTGSLDWKLLLIGAIVQGALVFIKLQRGKFNFYKEVQVDNTTQIIQENISLYKIVTTILNLFFAGFFVMLLNPETAALIIVTALSWDNIILKYLESGV
ncbi:hypothetical protein HYY69_00815 [Candidatus Woesearchaeota archaeon]|nr:hypothetical protein [Candidatus Woesearchaeota archaeon]